jgi:hypothetical protein
MARAFPGRFFLYTKPTQSERPRVNAVNARLLDTEEVVHLLIAPRCRELIQDLEEVVAKRGSTTGDIDKSDGRRTHVSDELGYYLDTQFPVGGDDWYEVEELRL